MSKYCEKCGEELREDAAFCSECGTPVKNQNTNIQQDSSQPSDISNVNEGIQDNNTKQNDEKTNNASKLENNNSSSEGVANSSQNSIHEPIQSVSNTSKKNKVAIILISVIIILLVIVFPIIIGSAFKRPVNNYFEGIEKADWSIYTKAFYPEYVETLEERISSEDGDDFLEEQREELVDDYGDKVKISFKIIEKERLNEEDIEEYKDEFRAKYLKRMDIKKAYKLDIDVTIKGQDDKETYAIDKIIVAKVGTKWYMIDKGDLDLII